MLLREAFQTHIHSSCTIHWAHKGSSFYQLASVARMTHLCVLPGNLWQEFSAEIMKHGGTGDGLWNMFQGGKCRCWTKETYQRRPPGEGEFSPTSRKMLPQRQGSLCGNPHVRCGWQVCGCLAQIEWASYCVLQKSQLVEEAGSSFIFFSRSFVSGDGGCVSF